MPFAMHGGVTHPQMAGFIPFNFVEDGLLTHRARLRCASAQKLVKILPIHHADKPLVDVNIHLVVGRRNHARAPHFGHQQMIRNFKVLDQARRNRATTRLGPALSVQHQDAPSGFGQIMSGCGTRRTAAHHHKIKISWAHDDEPPFHATGLFIGISENLTVPARMRMATTDEAKNISD